MENCLNVEGINLWQKKKKCSNCDFPHWTGVGAGLYSTTYMSHVLDQNMPVAWVLWADLATKKRSCFKSRLKKKSFCMSTTVPRLPFQVVAVNCGQWLMLCLVYWTTIPTIPHGRSFPLCPVRLGWHRYTVANVTPTSNKQTTNMKRFFQPVRVENTKGMKDTPELRLTALLSALVIYQSWLERHQWPKGKLSVNPVHAC